jgi:hypothetical protein
MVNYGESKIYRIVCNTTGLVYYGSTLNRLSRRLGQHKASYKGFKNGSGKFLTSYKVLENDNFEIILVENCPCNSKEELHARERFYIENNECVNIVVPLRTAQEYEIDNHEKRLKYYADNREKINERHKEYQQLNPEIRRQYYLNNIEMFKAKSKENREQNKERVKEANHKYREENKERLNEYNRKYIIANKETINEYAKSYYEKNKEEINAKRRAKYQSSK